MAAESRSCINIWDESQSGTDRISGAWDLHLQKRILPDLRKNSVSLVKEAKVVAMSGSVPKGLDGTAYQRLIKIVKEAGIPVILDTSGKLLENGN